MNCKAPFQLLKQWSLVRPQSVITHLWMPIQVGEKGIEVEFKSHDLLSAIYYLYDSRKSLNFFET